MPERYLDVEPPEVREIPAAQQVGVALRKPAVRLPALKRLQRRGKRHCIIIIFLKKEEKGSGFASERQRYLQLGRLLRRHRLQRPEAVGPWSARAGVGSEGLAAAAAGGLLWRWSRRTSPGRSK